MLRMPVIADLAWDAERRYPGSLERIYKIGFRPSVTSRRKSSLVSHDGQQAIDQMDRSG